MEQTELFQLFTSNGTVAFRATSRSLFDSLDVHILLESPTASLGNLRLMRLHCLTTT
jgi:hypothetical protein